MSDSQATSPLNDSAANNPSIEQHNLSSDITLNLLEKLPTLEELLPPQIVPYWQMVQKYPLLEALVIILLFWFLAYIIQRYAISLIEKIADKTKSDLDDQIITEIREPVFSTVIWTGVIIAAASAGFTDDWWQYLSPIILTIIVFTWLRVGMTLSSSIFKTLSRDKNNFKKIDIRTEPLLIICTKIVIFVVAAYFTLIIWGINPVGLLASAGIIGIAIGFAAKDTLANLFSGVFILADRPYKLGDYVNLDSGDRGKVTHIGIRSTRILTRDDTEVTIPNGIIGNAKVINENGGTHPKLRLRIALQVAYDSDLSEVNEILMQIAVNEKDVSELPTPRVRVRGFGESGINLELLCWVDDPEERGRVTHILYCTIHATFAEKGIEIPYPRRELQLLDHSPPANDDEK